MEHEWNMNGMAYRLNIDELFTQMHGRWMNWNIDRIWLGYWLTIDQVWSEYYIMEWNIDRIWLEYWLSIDGLWMESIDGMYIHIWNGLMVFRIRWYQPYSWVRWIEYFCDLWVEYQVNIFMYHLVI